MFLDKDFFENRRSGLVSGALIAQAVLFLTVIVGGAKLHNERNVSKAALVVAAVRPRTQGGQVAPTTVALPGSLQDSQTLEIPFPDLLDAPTSLPGDHRTISARVKSGDSLARVLIRHGGTYHDAAAVAQGLKAAGSSANSLRAGELLEIELAVDGQIVALQRKLANGDLLALRREGGNFVHTVVKPQVIETEVGLSNTIITNLSGSAAQVGLPHSVLDELVDLFSSSVEFSRDIQPGDSFSVIYTKRQTDSGDTLTPGPIQAASLMIGGRFMAAIRHVGKDGRAQYYDAEGHALGGSFLRYPVKFSRVSSVFSDARLHPVLKVRRPHRGIDFAAPVGTPVRAVADGVVIMAGWSGGGGVTLKIRHCGRYETVYMHLNKIASGIKKGSRVTRGQHVADVGRTGLTTGAHLHYEFLDRGRHVDPLKLGPSLFVSDRPKLPAKLLRVKIDALQRYHQVLTVAAANVGRRDARG